MEQSHMVVGLDLKGGTELSRLGVQYSKLRKENRRRDSYSTGGDGEQDVGLTYVWEALLIVPYMC